jgi:hypothetical protein
MQTMSDIKTWLMWILVFSWKLKFVKGGRLMCRVGFYASKYGILLFIHVFYILYSCTIYTVQEKVYQLLTGEYLLAHWVLYVERNIQILWDVCQKVAEYVQFVTDFIW